SAVVIARESFPRCSPLKIEGGRIFRTFSREPVRPIKIPSARRTLATSSAKGMPASSTPTRRRSAPPSATRRGPAAPPSSDRLPLRPAPAAARVEKLGGSRLHTGLLELVVVAEPAGDSARLVLLIREDEGDRR